MKRWERAAYESLVTCKGERLTYQWGTVSWFKPREQNSREIPKITLVVVVVVKKNEQIKVIMISNRREWQ